MQNILPHDDVSNIPDDLSSIRLSIALSARLTIKHSVDAKLPDAEEPHLPVAERLHDIGLVELLRALSDAVLPPQSSSHHLLLRISQKVGRTRVVRQCPIRDDAQDHGGNALNDHDPSPAAHALEPVHVANGESQQTTQATCNSSRDEEVSDPERELMLGVEKGEVDVETRKEAGLESAEEQTARKQGSVRVDEARQGGDDTPAHRDEGEPTAGGKPLQDEIRRDLEREVGDEQDGDGDLELVAL